MNIDLNGARKLLSAILLSAVSDIKRGAKHGGGAEMDNALYFVASRHCQGLCELLDVSYDRYRDYCISLIAKEAL